MSDSSNETVGAQCGLGAEPSSSEHGRSGDIEQHLRAGSFPGLTAVELRRHGPDRDAHMDAQRGQRNPDEPDTSALPAETSENERDGLGPISS